MTSSCNYSIAVMLWVVNKYRSVGAKYDYHIQGIVFINLEFEQKFNVWYMYIERNNVILNL